MDVFLQELHLRFFRNYREEHITFHPGAVVLCGPNGAGKTNILEAISVFSAGSGLRGAAAPDLLNTNIPEAAASGWAVGAGLSSDIQLGAGMVLDARQRARRVCKLQGVAVRSAARFHDYLRILGVTPEMDHLFTDASSSRRKFIDQCIVAADPDHTARLRTYEKAMRQRLSLLKSGRALAEGRWLDALEQVMAQESWHIILRRHALAERLHAGQESQIPLFPRFRNRMVGEVDAKAEALAEGDFIGWLQQRLRDQRMVDQAAGMTTVGCHRSDWEVWHCGNKRLARACSTGEQKITLLSVILSFVYQTLQQDDRLLLLLLDDVIARLDSRHRVVLFEQIRALQHWKKGGAAVHTFFSGTDLALFEGLEEAQIFLVENAHTTQWRA